MATDQLPVHGQNGWLASANANPTVRQVIAALAALPPDLAVTLKIGATTGRITTIDDGGLITGV
jgi:hypothetical protein